MTHMATSDKNGEITVRDKVWYEVLYQGLWAGSGRSFTIKELFERQDGQPTGLEEHERTVRRVLKAMEEVHFLEHEPYSSTWRIHSVMYGWLNDYAQIVPPKMKVGYAETSETYHILQDGTPLCGTSISEYETCKAGEANEMGLSPCERCVK
jgi:hypothetical protein